MINYSKTKVGFTHGADFVLSANSYVGYYHVIDGSAYQGANILDVSLPLDAKNNISEVSKKAGLCGYCRS